MYSSLNKSGKLLGIFGLLKGFRPFYFSAIGSLVVASLARTASFMLLRQVVDTVLLNQAFMESLLFWALLFMGLAAVEGTATFIKGKLASFATQNVIRRLRNFLFAHIQKLSFTYHDRSQTGELLERVTSDVETLETFFMDQMTEVGRILSLIVLNFIALMILNPILGGLSMIFIPVVLVISLIFFMKIEKSYGRYQEQEAVLSTLLQENLSAIRIVKAFARQDFETQRFEKENMEKYGRGKGLISLNALFWPFTDIICVAQMLLVFYSGALMAVEGTITPGIYIASCGIVIALIWPVRNLGQIIVQASSAIVSYKRVAVIAGAVPERATGRPAGILPEALSGRIEFEDVSFGYDEKTEVLHGITFSCEPGQRIAVLGPTGSGKTSLLGLLPRFYANGKGRIRIDGIDLTELPLEYLRNQIGIVEQEPFLFCRSIRENICFGANRDVSQADIEEAAKAAMVHHVITTFPQGYGTVVGERGVTLSGGQKQRIAIARALLRNPRILILDDATSSVDAETEHRIQAALETLMKGRTSFIIAHRVQTVMEADRIIVLDQGRIIQSGSHRELLDQPGFYRQVTLLQSMNSEKEELYV